MMDARRAAFDWGKAPVYRDLMASTLQGVPGSMRFSCRQAPVDASGCASPFLAAFFSH
jgi:hypothetical protein